jgi:hypothetical protein
LLRAAGIVAVRPRDLRRPGQGGVSALVTAPPGGRGFASGEELVFCHQVTVAPAVVRRGGQVQAGGWLPGHVTLGILEACLPDGEIEELAGDFGCAEERQRLLSSASTVRVIGEFPAVGGDLAVAGEVVRTAIRRRRRALRPSWPPAGDRQRSSC